MARDSRRAARTARRIPEPTAHLGPGGLLGQRFEQFDGAVTGFDVHPGRCVGDAVLFGCDPVIESKATSLPTRSVTGRS